MDNHLDPAFGIGDHPVDGIHVQDHLPVDTEELIRIQLLLQLVQGEIHNREKPGLNAVYRSTDRVGILFYLQLKALCRLTGGGQTQDISALRQRSRQHLIRRSCHALRANQLSLYGEELCRS